MSEELIIHDGQIPEAPGHQLALTDAGEMVRYALDKGASVEVMERMLALHERMKASAAKEAFDRALAAFQEECPPIVKTKAGPKQAYNYAPLDEILHQVKHLLKKHGFSYTITSEVEGDWVKAVVKVTHCIGHSELSEFKCPIDDNSRNMMSRPQRYGAAMTFAKRYAFTNAFGILTADEDLDARDKREGKTPRGFGPQRSPGEPEADDEPRQTGPPPRAAAPPASPARPSAPSTPPTGDPEDGRPLRSAIWSATKKRFADGQELQQYLWDEGVLLDTEELQKVGVARLAQILEAVKERMQ